MDNKLNFILAFLVVLLGACDLQHEENLQQTEKEKKGTGALFIIGGGDRPTSMVKRMIEISEIRNGGYAVVLPMASSVPDTSAYYGMLQFQKLGVDNIVAYNFADSTITSVAAKLDSLSNASLIYITGGVQSRFMKAVRNTPGLEEAIKEAYRGGALIAGTSAGAAVMSEIMITGEQKKHPEYTSTFYHLEANNIVTAEGLGLIKGVIIDQHFIKRARNNRLLTAVMEFPNHIGIGIDESTAIIVNGDSVRVVGKSQVLVYRNLSGTAQIKDGLIAAKNIRVDIYLPGETFHLMRNLQNKPSGK